MKLREKLTQRSLTEMPLRKIGEAGVRFRSMEDKRIWVKPNINNIAVGVQMNHGNKRYYHTVGHFPDSSWSELNKRAAKYIADVLADELVTRTNTTVGAFYEDVVRPYSLTHHKDSSGFLQRLISFVKSYENERVNKVKPMHIAGLVKWLSEGRDSPTVARYLAAYSKFFSLAIEHELIEKNPCKAIKKPPENPSRERYLSPEEILAFIAGAFHARNRMHALALLLCLFTGLRRSNVLGIKLCWFNHDFTVLRIPASESKSGTVIIKHLNSIAQEIIRLVYPCNDGLHLLPSKVPGQPMRNPNKTLAEIRAYVQEQTGITEHFHCHDLRRSWGTYLLEKSEDIFVLKEDLAHADIKTSLIYGRKINSKVQVASEQTAQALLGGRTFSSFITSEGI